MVDPADEPVTLSVALASFNGERYLAEQLSSIFAQSRLPTEIIVADDGSRDGTVDLVTEAFRTAATLGIRTSLLAGSAPLGVTANFARAISACSGELVVLCDQDDRWHEHRLRDAVDAFARTPELLFRHENARLIDEGGASLGETLFGALGISAAECTAINGDDAFALYLRRNLATGATVTFRRTLIDRAMPFPTEWVHDEWLAVIAAAIGRVAVSEVIRVDYRQHSGNEIGVKAPTLRYRIMRMLRSDPRRNAVLARRSQILADRLEGLPGVLPETSRLAEEKARFEQARSRIPNRRFGKIPAIWRVNRGGRYARFASQGRLDIIRDLVRKAVN